MAVHEDNSMYVPKPTAASRLLREKGTKRMVIIALALAAVWYVYDTIHVNAMTGVKWPTVAASRTGLAVLGLQNKDRMNFRHLYEARESNHSWQLRYRDDQMDSGDEAAPKKASDDPEAADRGQNNPGATHTVNSGAVVPMDEIFKNCPAVLDANHFTGAVVFSHFEPFLNKNYYSVNLDLNEEGRSRYWQFSRTHSGERMVFLINSETITCAIMDHMYTGTLTIDPIWIKEDADRLANFINKKGQ